MRKHPCRIIPSVGLVTFLACWSVHGSRLLAQDGSLHAPYDTSEYGTSKYSETALIGIFYDLKQDPKRKPLSVDYLDEFGKFVDSDWDETELSRFFCATRPMYATEVFMPWVSADAAPKEYDVDKFVQPSNWFVHYKGQVSPPEDGVYRFRGLADDVMAVAVNGKTVLVSHYGGWTIKTRWKETSGTGYGCEAGLVPCGDWFACKKDEIIDLDILIGEYPGGLSGAWLLFEKQGVTYPVFQDPKFGKQPIYPVFQLAPHYFKRDVKRMPLPFSFDGGLWKGRQ